MLKKISAKKTLAPKTSASKFFAFFQNPAPTTSAPATSETKSFAPKLHTQFKKSASTKPASKLFAHKTLISKFFAFFQNPAPTNSAPATSETKSFAPKLHTQFKKSAPTKPASKLFAHKTLISKFFAFFQNPGSKIHISKLFALTLLFLFTTLPCNAINDVDITEIVNFEILTADTAESTVITASAGGKVTNIEVQSNYIDIAIDNLSTITFNTTIAENYLKVTKQSGGDNYTITPSCPTTTATIEGTAGSQVVLKIEVFKSDQCAPLPPAPTAPSGGGSPSYLPAYTPTAVADAEFAEEIADAEATETGVTDGETTDFSTGIICERSETTEIPFSDTVNHWAEEYIETLYRHCVVDGRTPVLFMPNDNITRAEVLKIILNTYGIPQSDWENIYADVFSEDWHAGYVISATKRAIVGGYVQNGFKVFKPNQAISRAEALKMVIEARGIEDYKGKTTTFSDVQKEDWHYDYIAYAQSEGILNGYTEEFGNVFRPNNPITRAELAKIVLMMK